MFLESQLVSCRSHINVPRQQRNRHLGSVVLPLDALFLDADKGVFRNVDQFRERLVDCIALVLDFDLVLIVANNIGKRAIVKTLAGSLKFFAKVIAAEGNCTARVFFFGVTE